ncbi:MAG TPA: hypothetical protein VF707_16100 [Ardenticatenaceae bacterium]|jgi:hypothetical protein
MENGFTTEAPGVQGTVTPTVGASGENVTKGYIGNSSKENEIVFYGDYIGKRE